MAQPQELLRVKAPGAAWVGWRHRQVQRGGARHTSRFLQARGFGGSAHPQRCVCHGGLIGQGFAGRHLQRPQGAAQCHHRTKARGAVPQDRVEELLEI